MQEAWDKNGKLYYVDDNGNRVQPNQTYNPFEKLQRKAQANLENVKSFINNSDTNSQSYKDKINLALGLITAPMGGSSLLASKGATVLTPLVGKNIGKAISSSAIGGATGSGVAGFGRGLVEDKNPLLTMVSDGTLGFLFGGAFGLAGGKIGKKLAEKALAKGNIAPQKYFDDYVAGLAESDTLGKTSPFSKEFSKFKGLRDGYTPVSKNSGSEFDTPENIPLTETDNFKNWFGNSKVVDKNSKPLVVYHGSNRDFDTFDKNKIGSNYERDKKGFFFTSNKNEADIYGETAQYRQNAGQKKTYSTFLNIENPYTLEDLAKSFDYSDVNKFIDNKGELIQIYDDYVADIIYNAEKKGNDGIIFTDPKDGYTLAVAFEPTQIKSVNNQGTFDATNPNIYKSILPIGGASLFNLLQNKEDKI